MVEDFAESCPLSDTTGGFVQVVEWITRVVEHATAAAADAPVPRVARRSAAADRIQNHRRAHDGASALHQLSLPDRSAPVRSAVPCRVERAPWLIGSVKASR